LTKEKCFIKHKSMKIQFFTNTGKIRENNEDAILISSEITAEANMNKCEERQIETSEGVFVVADGMGGHAQGEVAAKLTLETIKSNKIPKNENEIRVLLQKARDRLERYIKETPEALGLGCAVAGMVINQKNGIAFNVGDCRVYELRNGELKKLTKDHSLVVELVKEGVIEEEEAKNHPYRNILTSAIIGDGYKTDLKIFTKNLEIAEKNKLLICSDGLWDELSESEILYCLNAKNPCAIFLKKLSYKPLKDNISFIVLSF